MEIAALQNLDTVRRVTSTIESPLFQVVRRLGAQPIGVAYCFREVGELLGLRCVLVAPGITEHQQAGSRSDLVCPPSSHSGKHLAVVRVSVHPPAPERDR